MLPLLANLGNPSTWIIWLLKCCKSRVMRFEWDEQKNKTNIRKHGLDFADAPEIFDEPTVVRLDTRQDYGEDRWIA